MRDQPVELGLEAGVVGIEEAGAALGDLGRVRLLPGDDTAARRRRCRRAQAGGGLAGIERHARRVAIDVDHRARDAGADTTVAPRLGGEGVELFEPPVGVLAGQPGGDEAGFDVGRDDRPGVRDADDQRGLAAR
jgi:hypothetical protein